MTVADGSETPKVPTFTEAAETLQDLEGRVPVAELSLTTGVDPGILYAILREHGQVLEYVETARAPGFICDMAGVSLFDATIAKPDEMTAAEMGEVLLTSGADVTGRLSLEGVHGRLRYSRKVAPVTHPGPLHYPDKYLEIIKKYAVLLDPARDILLEELLQRNEGRTRTIRDLARLGCLTVYNCRVEPDIAHPSLCVNQEEAEKIQQLLTNIQPFRETAGSDVLTDAHFLQSLKRRGVLLMPDELRSRLVAAGHNPTLYLRPNNGAVMGITPEQAAVIYQAYGLEVEISSPAVIEVTAEVTDEPGPEIEVAASYEPATQEVALAVSGVSEETGTESTVLTEDTAYSVWSLVSEAGEADTELETVVVSTQPFAEEPEPAGVVEVETETPTDEGQLSQENQTSEELVAVPPIPVVEEAPAIVPTRKSRKTTTPTVPDRSKSSTKKAPKPAQKKTQPEAIPGLVLPGRYLPSNLPLLKDKSRIDGILTYPRLGPYANQYKVDMGILIAIARHHPALKKEPIGLDGAGHVVASRRTMSALKALLASNAIYPHRSWCMLEALGQSLGLTDRQLPMFITEIRRWQKSPQLFLDLSYQYGGATKQLVFCHPQLMGYLMSMPNLLSRLSIKPGLQ